MPGSNTTPKPAPHERTSTTGHLELHGCRHEIPGRALGLNSPAQPFPWQSSILHQILNGPNPILDAVDIPIGLGKTASKTRIPCSRTIFQ